MVTPREAHRNWLVKIKLEEVMEDGLVIRLIEKPSEELQLAAVMQNGLAIKYLRQPSDEVMRVAVENILETYERQRKKLEYLDVIKATGSYIEFTEGLFEKELAAAKEEQLEREEWLFRLSPFFGQLKIKTPYYIFKFGTKGE